MFSGSSDCDVQNPSVLVERLLEGYISKVVPQELLEHLDVHQIPLLAEVLQFLPQRLFLLVREGRKVVFLAIEEILDGSCRQN